MRHWPSRAIRRDGKVAKKKITQQSEFWKGGQWGNPTPCPARAAESFIRYAADHSEELIRGRLSNTFQRPACV
jgi:hypothetical protein